MHEADEGAPLVAMLHGREGALPVEAPDFLQDGFEADAVFALAAQSSTCAWGKAVATARSSGLTFF